MGLISRVSSRTYRKEKNRKKLTDTMGNKPRGIKCARKLRNNRRLQRWADLDYKKAHLGTTLKANPFGGSSHAKGIVVEKIGVEAKQPNSAIRKCVRVQLIKNGKRITAFVPCDGSLNYIEENDHVTRFLKTEKKQQQQQKKPSIYDKLFKINIFLFFCSTVPTNYNSRLTDLKSSWI